MKLMVILSCLRMNKKYNSDHIIYTKVVSLIFCSFVSSSVLLVVVDFDFEFVAFFS
jgi:hypothetical protein